MSHYGKLSPDNRKFDTYWDNHNIEEPGGTEHIPVPDVSHGIDSQPVGSTPWGQTTLSHLRLLENTDIYIKIHNSSKIQL